MAFTFDATLKDMGRESPHGFLAAFDEPSTLPLTLINVDLSTVTASADLIVGLGNPLKEIVHMEFQSSAAAWKHADLLVYNALLHDHHHVPVHIVVILLRPEAAHSNMSGEFEYSARPGRGKLYFSYEVVRLWEEYTAEELLAADLGVVPLAMLGRLPESGSLEDNLAAAAKRVVERLVNEAPQDRAVKLLTKAFLLTGLRVRREIAVKVFRGVQMMEESDTYLMILEEGEEKGQAKRAKEDILLVGEERLGPPDDSVRSHLEAIADLKRLSRMMRRAAKANDWREIIETA